VERSGALTFPFPLNPALLRIKKSNERSGAVSGASVNGAECGRLPETVPTQPPVAGSGQQPKMLGCQQWSGEPEAERLGRSET